MKLCVVTATTNPEKASTCINSWDAGGNNCVIVWNGAPMDTLHDDTDVVDIVGHWIRTPEYLGSVPAFRLGVDYALEHTDADIICAFHDDLQLLDPDWQAKVIRHFEREPSCGLAGFGGAIGVGDADIYQTPYRPQQLARIGFRSNLVDAEVHGMRSLLVEPVACLDGFSQIGRRGFFLGLKAHYPGNIITGVDAMQGFKPWTKLESLGIRHHAYDTALGLLAARAGWSTWYLPIRCQHFGGRTAVGDQGYQRWAAEKVAGGDQGFWEQAHAAVYAEFRDQLPLRV